MGLVNTAHIFKRRSTGEREEVRIKLFDLGGNPIDLSGIAGEGLPSGGPGVLVREDADGVAVWAELTELDSVMKAVLVHSSINAIGSGYPSRPENVISAEWIGPEPGEDSENGDTWDEPVVP